MTPADLAQSALATAVLVIGVMLAAVGAFAPAAVCGLVGGAWLVRSLRRL
ncbi:hypothetical protein [Pseudonocardia hydrocarbonoxydans]|uniref:Uncharacterized protein n=1 Tax=Pseudonocardia hydrocarbonoxydans TaxID=76726 RepID=A0A4Y3WWB1_9PSEU|nr:hypothetical protein [Pseudonocardia hydrocarbonoxydans]GEC22380.1 hypothetical protein PHY01_46630 [Pseudonocardia hydrocarbonoxydans]